MTQKSTMVRAWYAHICIRGCERSKCVLRELILLSLLFLLTQQKKKMVNKVRARLIAHTHWRESVLCETILFSFVLSYYFTFALSHIFSESNMINMMAFKKKEKMNAKWKRKFSNHSLTWFWDNCNNKSVAAQMLGTYPIRKCVHTINYSVWKQNRV